jgi:hypothetical protein
MYKYLMCVAIHVKASTPNMIYTSLIQGTYIYIHDFINYVYYIDIYVYIYIYIYIHISCKINNVQSALWPCPQLCQNGPWHFYWGSSWEPGLENLLPLPRPRKINNFQWCTWPCPKLFQNYLLHVCQGSGWRPEWKMCSSWQDHAKSTMSSQPPDHAPSFRLLMRLGQGVMMFASCLAWMNCSDIRETPASNHTCNMRVSECLRG